MVVAASIPRARRAAFLYVSRARPILPRAEDSDDEAPGPCLNSAKCGPSALGAPTKTRSALIVHIHWLTWSRCRGPAFLENRYAVGQPQRTPKPTSGMAAIQQVLED